MSFPLTLMGISSQSCHANSPKMVLKMLCTHYLQFPLFVILSFKFVYEMHNKLVDFYFFF